MPHMPQKGEDHRSNHITTNIRQKRGGREEEEGREDGEKGL